MALEDLTGTTKFISALNPTWPTDDDWVDEGDNHLRGIKNVLKNTFPNIDGAVTLSEEQLNGTLVAVPESKIINGNFAIDQRGAGNAVTVSTAGVYLVDRYIGFAIGGGVLSVSRAVIAPAGEHALNATVQTPDATLAAGDLYALNQKVEGRNVADLFLGSAAAVPFTCGFDVYAPAGTYSVAFSNSAATRSYVKTFTVPVANTWQSVSVTVPGDTSGTWLSDTGVGLNVFIGLGVGSTFQSPAEGSWQNGNFVAIAGQTNFMANGAGIVRFRRVRLYPGSVDYGPCRRLYADELRLCQRYFEKSYNMDSAAGAVVAASESHYQVTSGGSELHSIAFVCRKRIAPAMTFYNPATGAAGTWRDQGAADRTVVTFKSNESRAVANVTNAPAPLTIIEGHWTASAEL